MPYQNRADLPESVRDNLPMHAQDIYKEAFNSAWDEYGHDESRAQRVAWGAVERKYHKDPSGKWVEGPTEDSAPREKKAIGRVAPESQSSRAPDGRFQEHCVPGLTHCRFVTSPND